MMPTLLRSRAVIRLSPQDAGEDVREFLQGLVTADVTGKLPAWAGLLSAQGKTQFEFLVWADGDDLLLDCEADFANELAQRLLLYRLRRKFDISRDDSLAAHWSPDTGNGVPDPRLASLGYRWLAPAAEEEGSADEAWLAHRLSLGVPEGRAETQDILWLETNAAELHGVSFAKGCYVGQENTARMNWRGKVNRRLVVVPLEGSDEKRRMAAYPGLGLAVDHLRLEQIDPAQLPDWQRAAITS